MVMDIRPPFGTAVHEDFRCTALNGRHCRGDYHCGFEFPAGRRGALARVLTGHEREAGPIGSISRLKRAAELRLADRKTANLNRRNGDDHDRSIARTSG